MSLSTDPKSGQAVGTGEQIDVSGLCAAYMDLRPDPAISAQRVAFGTSGHRGVSVERSFNEWHVLAISQAVCDYRIAHQIDGPLFLGIDTHALSRPALDSALEVLAANGVFVFIAADDEYTPTPAVSHAILKHNRERSRGRADGIVLTPSHNPPNYGGFKYNPPNGGPADTAVTQWIGERANQLLAEGLRGIKRMPIAQARAADTTRTTDYLCSYVGELSQVIDFDVIRSAGVTIGVDPMGGAGVHYWGPIAERYGLTLEVTNDEIDPQFAFMPVDWDGKIRMDPSSTHAMQRLIARKDDYSVAFACDTDHDRHGIVTPGAGLVESNHYLCIMIDHLFRHRPQWQRSAAIGKTLVSSALIDRVAKRLGRRVYEVPAGFKWFADGLGDASLGFAGEESAGAAFLRRDGTAWTTDKDGMIAGLLAAEITARTGRDPGVLYQRMIGALGEPITERVEAPANAAQKAALGALTRQQVDCRSLAGERVDSIVDRAPGNNAPIGGIKVRTANGWFAARPSGTEDIYKIYAESFRDSAHLAAILAEAQQIVDRALARHTQPE
ncbi:MAG: phosphoglucomutase (alpha-D-glucose-1,6-bisphosphate-dependent) [Salinisphaera sp.]|jgi:phosphoglucomutase|nr:phosphoglucomutase (alpha-D-glucose-1,6-bisphosphate-dependent) [Salinisphaera sp.]